MAATRRFGTIRKLPSGRYQARYSHLGKQIGAEVTFATKTDARAWLSQIEVELTGGQHHDPTSGQERFGRFAARWLEARDIRPGTRATYQSQLTHILKEFENVELRKITPTSVRTWHGHVLQSGISPNTVAKVYRLFRTMMDTAVDDGLIRSNPVHIRGAAAEKTPERPIPSWEDVARIADTIEPRFSALIWTAATSGLRYGELTGLTRRHVDLTAPTLRVEQALSFINGQGATLGPPKSTAAYRTVTLPASTAQVLAQHLDQFTESDSDALVFTSAKGSPLLRGYFAPDWEKTLHELGLEGLRFHDFRHLAGTTAATAGGSLREVMSRMGHASPDASLRYLKASESRDAEIATAIESQLQRR